MKVQDPKRGGGGELQFNKCKEKSRIVLACLVFRGGRRDDDSYSVRVRIQVLTPMIFNKAPDNFLI